MLLIFKSVFLKCESVAYGEQSSRVHVNVIKHKNEFCIILSIGLSKQKSRRLHVTKFELCMKCRLTQEILKAKIYGQQIRASPLASV